MKFYDSVLLVCELIIMYSFLIQNTLNMKAVSERKRLKDNSAWNEHFKIENYLLFKKLSTVKLFYNSHMTCGQINQQI